MTGPAGGPDVPVLVAASDGAPTEEQVVAARALLAEDPLLVVVTVVPELAASMPMLGDDACLGVHPGPALVPAGRLSAEPAPGTDDVAAWVAWAFRLQQRGAVLGAWPPAPPRWPWDGPVVAPVPPGDRHLEPALADTVPIRAWRRGLVRQWSVPTLAVLLDVPATAAAERSDLAVERLLAGSWSDLVVVPTGPGAAGVLDRFRGEPRVRPDVPPLAPLLLVVEPAHAPDAVGVECLLDRLDRHRLDALTLVTAEESGPVLLRRSALARAAVTTDITSPAVAAVVAGGLPESWLVQAGSIGWSLTGAPPGATWDPARWGARGLSAQHDHQALLEREARVAELTREVTALATERDRARAAVAVWRARARAWRPRGARDWGRTVKSYLGSARRGG